MSTATQVRARHGSYIFQRPGSANWYVKLRSPGETRKEISLGTPDKLEAELKAAPMVAAHKAKLLAARARIVPTWQPQYAPGLHDGPNGERIAATERELAFYDADGKLLRTEPNGGTAFQLTGGPLTMRSLAEAYLEADFGDGRGKRPVAPTKNGDDAILETYLKHANISGYYESEARDVWALYKRLTNSKALKDSDRDDGRKLVAHFEAEGLKSATIEKKVGWLRAAVNLAIEERKECRSWLNPFAGVIPKRKDKQRRLPLSDADMATIKRNLSQLDKSDQLLLRLLACTGMRLSEAFEICEEATERGVRYVICGKKTEESLRRVPLPAGVLPYLPKKITGPLFASDHADPSDAASKRLNRFLRQDCGITDPAKVMHSLRHRAQDRLRAAGCPEDIRWAILGHEERTIAAGYGEGFPVPLLRKWVDKIGL